MSETKVIRPDIRKHIIAELRDIAQKDHNALEGILTSLGQSYPDAKWTDSLSRLQDLKAVLLWIDEQTDTDDELRVWT